MRLNRIIRVCVSREDVERIKADAELNGFSSLSPYLRHLALKERETEGKINIIFKKVVG